jgi:catechol 2,3-dioxygenase-like lactoylglutathione lyase family enzyme
MSEPVISAVGHTAVRVRDLDAALWTATEIMGLRESHRDGDTVYLTHGAPHHSMQLIASDVDAVDHLGFEAAGPDALERLRARLDEANVPILSDRPRDEVLGDGVVFQGPAGFVIEVYLGMPQGEPDYIPRGVRPRRLGHFNALVPDPPEMVRFFTDLLDFRICDHLADGAFLRCNSEHHGIAILNGPGKLHHHGWQVESIAEVARLGDVLHGNGQNLLWGPIRHGIGENIAGYFADPSGLVVEYYADMEEIRNEHEFEPRTWDPADGHKWFSFWAPLRPEGDWRQRGLVPAA